MRPFLLLWVVFLPLVQSIGIILPLHFWPGQGCKEWAQLISSIESNSNVPFYSVVNPDSGPGRSAQPDAEFRECVPRLRPSSHGRALVLGYIDTDNGKSSSQIQEEVNLYAGWDSAYRPTGIFFDGAATSQQQVSTYNAYVQYARSKGFTFTALNPGSETHSDYFGITDLVNTFATSYSEFGSFSASSSASKESVMLVRAPSSGSYESAVSRAASQGIAAIFVTDFHDGVRVPTQWTSFVTTVSSITSGGGGPPSNNDPPTSSSTDRSTTTTSNTSNDRSSATTSDNRTVTSSGSSNAGESTSQSGGQTTATGTLVAANKSTTHSAATEPGGTSTDSNGNLVRSTDSNGNLLPTSNPEQGGEKHSSSPPIGAIVGGVLGGLIIIALTLWLFWCTRRAARRRKELTARTAQVPFTSSSPIAAPELPYFIPVEHTDDGSTAISSTEKDVDDLETATSRNGGYLMQMGSPSTTTTPHTPEATSSESQIELARALDPYVSGEHRRASTQTNSTSANSWISVTPSEQVRFAAYLRQMRRHRDTPPPVYTA